jgi:hypothetical protein
MSPSVLRSDHNRFFLCHGYRRRTASVSRAAAEAVVRTALRAWEMARDGIEPSTGGLRVQVRSSPLASSECVAASRMP